MAKILTVEAKTVKTKTMTRFKKKRLKSTISQAYFERLYYNSGQKWTFVTISVAITKPWKWSCHRKRIQVNWTSHNQPQLTVRGRVKSVNTDQTCKILALGISSKINRTYYYCSSEFERLFGLIEEFKFTRKLLVSLSSLLILSSPKHLVDSL